MSRLSVMAAVVVVAMLGAGCDDREDSTPATTSTMTAAPSASPAGAGTPSATATAVVDITRVSVLRGGVATGEWGLVTGNGLTGGAEVWLMPGGTEPAGISPSGRYFAWGDFLFDGWTGSRTKINDQPDAIVLASFARDERHVYVQNAGGTGRVLRLDGTQVARLPDVTGQLTGRPSQLHVVWSPDSRGVAVTRYAGGTSRVDVVVDGRLQPPIEGTGMAGWSQQGLRLAVTADRAAIYDFEDGTSIRLERSGDYPSWSGDDRYVAVDISNGDVRGLSVLDAVTGTELMRVYSAYACFDIHWSGSLLLPGWTYAVDVPSATLVPRPSDAGNEPYPRLTFDQGGAHWEDSSGVYAEARIEGDWAASFSWTRRDVDHWPPVVFLGPGGKDACLDAGQTLVLVTPPFTPDKIPTPTPTPDK